MAAGYAGLGDVRPAEALDIIVQRVRDFASPSDFIVPHNTTDDCRLSADDAFYELCLKHLSLKITIVRQTDVFLQRHLGVSQHWGGYPQHQSVRFRRL